MTYIFSDMRGSSPRMSRRSRTPNGPLALFLFVVVACAAVPFGSNRPFFWAFWAALLGACAVLYGLAMLIRRSDFHVRFGAIKLLALPYLAFCLALLLQLAPLGGLYWGNGIATQTGTALHPPFISSDPGQTLLMLLRWVGYGLMFFLLLQAAFNDGRRRRLLQALAAAITVHALLGILSYYQWGNTILGFEKWAHLDSMTGTFVNRNSFATFIALGLTLTTGLAVHAFLSNRGQRRLTEMATYGLAMIFLVGALLGSNSRMGPLVGTVGPLTTIASYLVAVRTRGQVIWAMLLLAAVVALAASLYGTGVWTRFFEIEVSGRDRMELYAQVWGMILKAPWFGFGGGSFGQAYQVFHQPPVHTELVWERAHNTYLSLWSELGFIAGSLPLLLVAIVTAFALRAMRKSELPDPALPIWLGAVVIAMLHSLVDFSFEMFAIALAFTTLGALATAAALPKARRRSTAVPPDPSQEI